MFKKSAFLFDKFQLHSSLLYSFVGQLRELCLGWGLLSCLSLSVRRVRNWVRIFFRRTCVQMKLTLFISGLLCSYHQWRPFISTRSKRELLPLLIWYLYIGFYLTSAISAPNFLCFVSPLRMVGTTYSVITWYTVSLLLCFSNTCAPTHSPSQS